VPLHKGSRDRDGAQDRDQLRDGLWGGAHCPPPTSVPPSVLIELPSMDRETARRNMRAGLVAGGIAAGIFALSFVAAFLYIAQ
jgi:hypothetical protein